MSNSYLSIFVKNMHVHVRIGLLDVERTAPQPLQVSVEVFANLEYLSQAVAGEALMDYAQLHKAIKAWETRPHTELLETLLQDLLQHAFALPQAQRVQASIGKTQIFDQAQQAGLAVDITRAVYQSQLRDKT